MHLSADQMLGSHPLSILLLAKKTWQKPQENQAFRVQFVSTIIDYCRHHDDDDHENNSDGGDDGDYDL